MFICHIYGKTMKAKHDNAEPACYVVFVSFLCRQRFLDSKKGLIPVNGGRSNDQDTSQANCHHQGGRKGEDVYL
jgi:hypothetical protein